VKNHALIREAAAPSIMTTSHARHGPESTSIGNWSLLAGLCSRLTTPTSALVLEWLFANLSWRRACPPLISTESDEICPIGYSPPGVHVSPKVYDHSTCMIN
jgi:hypothetical protein